MDAENSLPPNPPPPPMPEPAAPLPGPLSAEALARLKPTPADVVPVPAPTPAPPETPRLRLSRWAVASVLWAVLGFFPLLGLAGYSLVRAFVR